MSRVFTVYNCGTGFNRENTGELIANLGKITQGMEARPGNMTPVCSWMINDGPGSKAKDKKSGARTPGRGPEFLRVGLGTATGYGWEYNVDDTMGCIKWMHSQKKITTVNMAGWSRGAVTCHMIAHALRKDRATKSIAVNIFAVDPVAGPGNRNAPDKNSLPSNVADYTAIISQHENRTIMKPVDVYNLRDKAEEAGAGFNIVHIPGEHNTGVLKGTPAGKLVWYLAHTFLTKHGTALNSPLQLSPLEICELYAGTAYYMKEFRGMTGTTGKQLGTKQRSVQNQFLNHHYWVNQHHLANFMKAFPKVSRLITNPNLLANEGMFDDELHQIGTTAPWTYTSMRKIGLMA